MADTLTSPSPAPRVAPFIVYVATVLTVAMVLFPPFTSLGGTEYAFVLTGPEWAGQAGSLGAELGLSARVHWARLAVQLGVVWALAYGARRFLAPPS